MNSYLFLFISLFALQHKFPESNQFNRSLELLKNTQNINLQKGTLIILNNQSCGLVMCGETLYRYVETKSKDRIARDSIVWLITLKDTALISSINKVPNSYYRIIQRNELNKYGIITIKHAQIKVKRNKISCIDEF